MLVEQNRYASQDVDASGLHSRLQLWRSRKAAKERQYITVISLRQAGLSQLTLDKLNNAIGTRCLKLHQADRTLARNKMAVSSTQLSRGIRSRYAVFRSSGTHGKHLTT